MFQDTVLDHVEDFGARAFPVKRSGRGAAALEGVVDHPDAGGKHRLAHPVLEETRLAGNGGTVDRPHQMPEDAARGPRFINDVGRARGQFLWIEAADRPLAGAAPNLCRRFQILEEGAAVEIVVALHGGSVPGHRRHGHAIAGRHVGAFEPVTGRQNHAGQPPGRPGAARLAHAVDRQAGRFRFHGDLRQLVRRHLGRVQQLERRQLPDQEIRVGKACIGILGRYFRHGDGAFRQACRIIEPVGRHRCGALSDKDAQRDIVAFRPLGLLDLAFAHVDTQRHAGHRDRVTGICARLACRFDKPCSTRLQFTLVNQVRHVLPLIRHLVRLLFTPRAPAPQPPGRIANSRVPFQGPARFIFCCRQTDGLRSPGRQEVAEAIPETGFPLVPSAHSRFARTVNTRIAPRDPASRPRPEQGITASLTIR